MKIPLYNSLKFRMPLIVLGGAIPLILGAMFFASDRAIKTITNESEHQRNIIAKLLADDLNRWNKSNIIALKNLSQQPDIIEMNDPSRMKSILKTLVENQEIFYLAHITNLEGKNIARSDNSPAKYYGDRSYFKGAIAGKDINYQILIGRTSKKPALCMATPVRQQKIKIVGVATTCIDLADLSNQVDRLKFGKTGYAFIVDRSGKVLAHPDRSLVNGESLTDFSNFIPVQQSIEANRSAKFAFQDDFGKDWLSWNAPLDNGWMIIIVQEKADFLNSQHEFEKFAFSIAEVAAIAVIVLTSFLANRLIRPISNLTDAASAISNGEFSEPITLNRNDELGILAQSFERMRIAIKKSNEQLRYAALHDRLTGLPNRAFFNHELTQLITISQQDPDYLFAVLFIDLDGFKMINDTLGHEGGDLLLIDLARKLKASTRQSDLIARLGGDEFVILLKQIQNLETATTVADRILEKLSVPIGIKGHEVFASASIGIALSHPNYQNIDDFLRDADTAMYEAKANGKARYTIFEPNMHFKVKQRLDLDRDLRFAIDNQELELFYQPIVNLSNQKITGFEALIRWRHPDRGLIDPDLFIPIAEEAGTIVSIDYWVLHNACQTLSQWLKLGWVDPDFTISVNISPIQFARDDFIEQISQILAETSLEPQHLQLEITETTVIKNIEDGKLIIQQLSAMGIKISLDDFGTGYSSLSYLYQLPINSLKIDRSFINNLEHDSNKLKVIRTIILLARNLDLNVIAEGIETEQQQVLLCEYCCEYGQGYFFSEPLPLNQANNLIQKSLDRV